MRHSRTVTMSLPPELADEMDRLAASERRTRSELLREAIRHYAQTRKRWDELFAYGRQRAKATGLTNEDKVAEAVAAYRRRSRGR